jgi:hypothetical protein
MTQKSRLIVLSAAFVVLLGIYLIGSLTVSRAGRSPVAGDPVIAESLAERSRTVRLSGGREQATTTVLADRADGGWGVRIEDGFFPADDERIEGLLDALVGLRKVRVAATGEEYFEDFDLAGDAARVVVLEDSDGGELARILFGKAVSGGGQMYARGAGEENVFIVDRDIGFYFGQQRPYWSDLVPLPDDLTGGAVTRITLSADLQVDTDMRVVDRFTVFREPADGATMWRLDTAGGNEPQTLDQEEVDIWASRIVELEASAFVADPPLEPGLAEPSARLSFEDEAGRAFEVRIGGAADEARFYLQATGPGVDAASDGEPFLYTVSSWQVRRILRNRDALVARDTGAGS